MFSKTFSLRVLVLPFHLSYVKFSGESEKLIFPSKPQLKKSDFFKLYLLILYPIKFCQRILFSFFGAFNSSTERNFPAAHPTHSPLIPS